MIPRSTVTIVASALFLTTLTHCAELNDPYYGGGYRDNDSYRRDEYHDDYEYRRRRERERYHDERRHIDRERDRVEDERRRLEEEQERLRHERRERYNTPPPPPPRSDLQLHCPPGYSESERKCSKEERKHGCKDVRLNSGIGCVKR